MNDMQSLHVRQPEVDEIDLRRVFDLLRRRIWLILLITLTTLAAGGATLFALKPVYTATALVMVDPSRKDLLDPDPQMASSSSDSLRVDSEVELVKSETTLISVARVLNLVEDAEFGLQLGLRDTLLAFFRIAEPRLPSGDEALAEVLGKLRDAVSVQRRGLTFLIAINARSGRPEFAAQIANVLAAQYIDEQLQSKERSILTASAKIDSRIEEARASVAQSEQSFDQFIDTNLMRISEATGQTDLLALRSEIDAVSVQRQTSANRVAAVEKSLAERDWASIAQDLRDEAVASLERQRSDLLRRLEAAEAGGDVAASLRQGVDDLEQQLNAAVQTAVAGLQQQVQVSQARTSELRTELRQAVLSSELPAEILTNIYSLQQSAEIARTLYQTLLTRQQDLRTQAALQVPDSRVVAEATPPSSPSFPNPRLILSLAALAGLALGVGAAFLIENFVGGFTDAGQAQSVLHLPVAATVPRQKIPKRASGEALSVADNLIVAPLSNYSESIRRIKLAVEQATRRPGFSDSGRRQGIVVVVSSAAPNEGKSTIALSLMRAFGMGGRTTLLIDCDMRRPSIHKQLGIEPSEGLLDYLTARQEAPSLEAILAVDEESGAKIIRGSRRSDVPTDPLLGSETFRRLMDAARQSFDVVILDSPPVGPVVDGLYLAELADVVLFVVKWSGTPQQQVKTAITALDKAKKATTPLMLVLNQQNPKTIGYGGKYGSYYGYN